MSTTLVEQQAIGRHRTATDTESAWDGPAAVRNAPADAAVLRYMHAVYRGGPTDQKQSYALPHHAGRRGSAANIRGVNNALARLPQTQGIGSAREGAERHLRGHRRDAGLDESMSEAEIREAAGEVARTDGEDVTRLIETLREQESAVPTLQEPVTLDLRETTTGFMERADGGQVLLRVIEPGQGSSGFYPAEVLERDGPSAFPAGTHMYWDHPTQSEDRERPERSLRDLAAVLTEDAHWEPDHPQGAGLYAHARVFGPYRQALDDLAPHIGVSIRASGQVEAGDTGPVVTRIVAGHSVDFVTQAGAGGSVVQLFEAAARQATEARNAADWIEVEIHRGVMGLVNAMWGEGGTLTRDEWEAVNQAVTAAMATFRSELRQAAPQLEDRDPVEQTINQQMSVTEAPAGGATESEEDDMADQALQEQVTSLSEQVAKLQEQIGTLEAERDEHKTARERAEDALRIREARDHADSVIDEHATDLPGRARTRVAEASLRDLPTLDDGKLDRDKLAETVRANAEAERAYLAETVGAGKVSGMGAGSAPSDGPRTADDYQALGLSEADAKAAARIHA